MIPHLQKIPGLTKRELKGFIVQKSFHYHIPYPEADTISHDEDMLSWKQKRKRKLDIYSNPTHNLSTPNLVYT